MAGRDVLDLEIGGRAVGENLRRAVEAGQLIEHPDGTFGHPRRGSKREQLFLFVNFERAPDCPFLNRFMFGIVYAEAAVPQGCASCYKVKVMPRTLRQLVAVYELAKSFDCASKFGLDFYNPYSQQVYAGYFYLDGLEAARALHGRLRAAMDASGKLGPDVALAIKRGCSNYEIACGPSDRYTFSPELRDIEAHFRDRYRRPSPPSAHAAAVLYRSWVPFAYQIGDETYLDFTNGRPLHPPSVSYPATP